MKAILERRQVFYLNLVKIGSRHSKACSDKVCDGVCLLLLMTTTLKAPALIEACGCQPYEAGVFKHHCVRNWQSMPALPAGRLRNAQGVTIHFPLPQELASSSRQNAFAMLININIIDRQREFVQPVCRNLGRTSQDLRLLRRSVDLSPYRLTGMGRAC